MDFAPTDEQQALRDLAHQILAGRGPFADDATYPPRPDGWFDETAWKQLADANLLGVALPESVDGLGLGLAGLVQVLEEAGRALTCVPLVPALASAGLAVAEFGSEAQQQELLPGLVDGSHLLTAALAEPGSHDPMHLHTDAVATSDGWTLTGTKAVVSMAEQARCLVVPAGLPDGRAIVVLVRPDAPGVRLEALQTPTGEPQHDVHLDGVVVSEADVLAGPDEGLAALRWIVERTNVGLAAVQLGIAEQELAVAASYTSQREQFGRPIASFQAVACRIADALIDTRAMRVTLQQAVWLLDQGRPAEREVAIAKLWAAEGGERVATQAVYLHGGMGVDTDYPLHHYFLASKMLELQLGSASWQVVRLGRHLAATAGAGAGT